MAPKKPAETEIAEPLEERVDEKLEEPKTIRDAIARFGRETVVAELRSAAGDLVTLYPLEGVFVADVAHVEQTVSVERAVELLEYSPPAFTVEKPPQPAADVASAEPSAAADEPTIPAGDAGATPQEV